MTQIEENPIADRDGHKFTLRLTEHLHRVILEQSIRQGRSMNTEILLRLAETVEDAELQRVREVRTHLAAIEFLANAVQEMAELLTAEQRSQDRIRTILELSSSLSPKSPSK